MAKKEDRHYWLKISEDFFDDEAVAWLEEKSPAYALFYLKLCLRAARNEGMLVRHVGDMFIPYEPKKLAEVAHVDLDTAVVALQLMEKAGLAELRDDGAIYLAKVQAMTGSETQAAQRMRRIRASRAQKMQLPEPSVNKGVTPSVTSSEHSANKNVTSSEQCSNNVREMFADCSQNVQIPPEDTKYLQGSNIYKYNNNNNIYINKNSRSSINNYDYDENLRPFDDLQEEGQERLSSDMRRVLAFYEENFSTISSFTAECLGNLVDEYTAEWVLEGMKRCAEGGRPKCNLRYLEGVLRGWRADGTKKPWQQRKEPATSKEDSSHVVIRNGVQFVDGVPVINSDEDADRLRELQEEEARQVLAAAQEAEDNAAAAAAI